MRFSLHYKDLILVVLLLLLATCAATPTNKSRVVLTRTPEPATSSPSPAISGRLAWIDDCQFPAQRGRGLTSYRGAPTYRSVNGTKPQDVALFGHGWILADTGTLYTYSGATQQCLTDVIATVKEQHARVFAVLGVSFDPSGQAGWTLPDILSYEKRAVEHPALLKPIIQMLEQYHYDGLIVDIEVGDRANPQLFTSYCNTLHHVLLQTQHHYPLGIALIHRTHQQSETDNQLNQFQDWSGLAAAADFLIVMALDMSHGTVGPLATGPWLAAIYDYAKEVLPNRALSQANWELAAYCNWWAKEGSTWKNVGTATDCTYEKAQWLTDHIHHLHPPGRLLEENGAVAHYIGEDGTEYQFAHPQTVLLFQQLFALVKEDLPCIQGSYWQAGLEGNSNLIASLNANPHFC